jgi:quercetin dioxygenase-like cupin family protein
VDEPIALGPGEGTPVKADRPELSLLEIAFDPGSGVDPHFHKGHSDSFYVLEGEVEFHVGDEVVHATPGSYVLAPPNVVHWFRNVSDEPVRMLNLHTPGGFVRYRKELRELRAQGIQPDRAFFERHDVFDVD